MISNAIMLMFIGMGIVFIFLVLLNVAISLLERITREHTLREELLLPKQRLLASEKRIKKVERPVIVAYRRQLFLQPFMLTEMLKWF